MASPYIISRFSAPLRIAAESTPEQGSDLSENAVCGKPCCQVESHFCSQTDHLTPPKGVSVMIASQAIKVLLSRPWGACLAPERVSLLSARASQETRERLSTWPEGKGLLPGAEPLQVRDAGMQRFPGFSPEPRSLSEVVDL